MIDGARAVAVVLAVAAVGSLLGAPSAAAASASSPQARRAVAYLRRAQNRDGGLGAAPGQASAQLFAGWAALGLASAGVDVGALRRAGGDPTLLTYVRSGLGATDPGSLERSILVLRAAGASTTGLADGLARRVSERGSIGGLVNLTAFGLLALRAADAPGTQAAQARARRWLCGQADRDGGYGYAGRGSGSDADDTGAVLEALGGAAGTSNAAVARARRGAVGFLGHDQDGDGGFADGPGAGSNAQSTAWAIQGLIAAGVAPASLRRNGHTPMTYLDSLVTASGAVRYSRGVAQTPVWVTGEALMALTATPLPLVGHASTAAVRSRRRVPTSSTSTATVATTPGRTDAVPAPAAHGGSARPRQRATRPAGMRHGGIRQAETPRPGALPGRSRSAALTPALARMEMVLGRLPARVIAGVGLGAR